VNRPALRGIAWWPLAGLLAGGCYGWVSVPPTELPKLDDSGPRPPVQGGEVAWPVVRDVDGDPVEVIGPFKVKVTTKEDRGKFRSPLRCSVADGGLLLSEDGGSPKSFPLSEIKRTEVYRYKTTTSNIAVAVGIAATLGLILFTRRSPGACRALTTMDRRRRRARAWPFLLALLATGCYEWVRVPPSELPRLDESAPRPIVRADGVVGPVIRAETGKTIEVAGEFAVRVTTEADSADFMGPLHCSLTEGSLHLAEDGAPPQSFRLDQIRSTEVYRRDETLSALVEALGVVAAGAAVVVLGYAVAHSGP
jgi:hypothetical protein